MTITTVNVTNATTGVVTNTTVNTTTTYPGYDQPHMCCDSDLAPFSNYVRFDDFAQGVFVVLQVRPWSFPKSRLPVYGPSVTV